MKDQRINAIIKYFADFFDSWDYQSKIAMTTFVGIIIALFCLIPFHINGYVLFGSIFGVLIFGLIVSNRTATKGHQEQQPQQLGQSKVLPQTKQFEIEDNSLAN